MLHSVVTCCTVLQHAAQCCNMLYSVATCCAVLQHAVHAAALCRPDAASAPSSAPNVRRSCRQCTRPVSGAVLHPVFNEWHAHACAPRARTLAHSHTHAPSHAHSLTRSHARVHLRTRAVLSFVRQHRRQRTLLPSRTARCTSAPRCSGTLGTAPSAAARCPRQPCRPRRRACPSRRAAVPSASKCS